MTQPAPGGATVATDISYIRARLQACLNLIDATPETDRDKRALVWMLVEELTGLVSRIWRWAR